MARKGKDNPTNMGADDVAQTLRNASGQLVEAADGLEAARVPIKAAKAAVKATGIDFDIFKLCHGIRHLDDDDARQKRIRKLQAAIAALLGDKVQLDLFGFMTAVVVEPAAQKALREASDELHEADPDSDSDAEPQDQDLPFDPPTVPTLDEPAEDAPVLVVAADMPEGAGFAFNNGMQAGRQGFDADANPHEAGSAEATLWEDGRTKGEALGPVEEDAAPASEQPAASTVVEFTGTAEQKRLQAYFYGFDNATKNPINALTKGRRGEIKARIEAGFQDNSEGLEPRYPRPAAPKQDDAAAQLATDADDGAEATEPARVGVKEVDGKLMLVDLLSGSPLMDVSSQRTGDAWAMQINEHFADRLDSAPRAELIDAVMTLARGRMLVSPATLGAAPAYDLRSAV